MASSGCTVDGCDRPHLSRGWCVMHYSRWRATGDPGPAAPQRVRLPDKTCTVEGCTTRLEAHGLCVKHLRRRDKHGDTSRTDSPQGTPLERFLAQTDRTGDCWLWTGSDVSSLGYARFKIEWRRVLVHRWSYEQHVRPLRPGEVVDHLCSRPLCVNPAHLRATTQRNNVIRSLTGPSAINARKTQCKYGHPFSGDNLILAKDGSRQCRACTRRRARESLARKRQAKM